MKKLTKSIDENITKWRTAADIAESHQFNGWYIDRSFMADEPVKTIDVDYTDVTNEPKLLSDGK